MTGFGPFQTVVENPSSLIAAAVDGKCFGDVQVTGRQIDVSWSQSFTQVKALVDELSPDALVCFGVARSPVFRLEVMAENVASKTEDAFGERFESGPLGQILSDAPAALFSTLPLAFLLRKLNSRCEQSADQDSTLSGSLSHDAGQYLCNYLFFRVMNELDSVPVRGFIHVPPRASVDGSSTDEVIDAGEFLVQKTAAWLAKSTDE